MRAKKIAAFLVFVLLLNLHGSFAYAEGAEQPKQLCYVNLSGDSAEDDMSLKLTVTNTEGKAKVLSLIQAVYDENGRLLDVSLSEGGIAADESKKTFSFNVLENKTAAHRNENSIVKCFAWESGTLQPAAKQAEAVFVNNTEVSRLTACLKLAGLLEIYPTVYANAFTDVSDTQWYAGYLQSLCTYGILESGSDFDGDRLITQGELLQLCKSAYAAAVGNPSMTDTALAASLFGSYSEQAEIPHGTFMKCLSKLEKLLADAGFSIPQKAWYEKTILYKISDEIAPSESFQLYGENLYYTSAVSVCSTTTDESFTLTPIQRDTEGHFLSVLLPAEASGGVYTVSVTNGHGTSNKLLLNQPRPFWVAESDVLMQGMTAKLIGTNLAPENFGAKGTTQVKLRVNDTDYPAQVTKQEPYKLEFNVPETAEGACTVFLSSDGINWTELDNEQELTLRRASSDPYGLGVGWARDYNYSNKVNVKDYGAKGDGVTSDYAAFVNAMTTLKELGGGILYVPKGKYVLQHLSLLDGVILEGESRTETILLFPAEYTQSKFIYNDTTNGQNGRQGITNLTIKGESLTTDSFRDYVIHLFDNDSTDDIYYKDFFIKDVTVELPLAAKGTDEDGRTYRMMYRADISKNFLMKNCDMKGTRAGFMPIAADYATVTDCTMEAVASSLESTGCYALFENNTITLHPEYRDCEDNAYYAQGIFTRSHFYAAENTFKNLGTDGITEDNISNDGEIICSENPNGGTVKMAGSIAAATETTATLSALTYIKDEETQQKALQTYGTLGLEENDLTAKWGSYYLEIIDGRGLGQYRRVTAIDNGTVTLDKPWDVVPDSGSKFLLMTMTAQSVMYKNRASNAQKGFWLYGGSQDCIIADNVGGNVGGSFSVGFDVRGSYRRMPAYFITIKNNTFTGCAAGRNHCAIASTVACETQEPLGYSSYGTVIKGNSMTGANQTPQAWNKDNGVDPYFSEAPNKNGIVIGNTAPYGEPERSVVKAVTIENNTLTDMTDGITVMGRGTSGVLLTGNEMNSVATAYTLDNVKNLKNLDEE